MGTYVFQFHIGTIKSPCHSLSILCWMNFNSTLVRLKAFPSFRLFPVLPAFQFHIGTIKSRVFFCFNIRDSHFNSTLVRLKASGLLRINSEILFQFHIGTIKRAARHKKPPFFEAFQFHIGTIKRGIIQRYITQETISIPHWYD